MSNLYEILEVSEKASKEVIEKAYRVLAKKYHPDLQKQEEKQSAEKKMKQINEAYDILSDEVKRREYDKTLAEEREREKQRQSQMNNNETRNRAYQENKKQESNTDSYQNIRKIQKEMKQAYSQAYRNYVRSLRISSKRAMDMGTIYEFIKSTWNYCNYYPNDMVFSTNQQTNHRFL